MEMYSIIIIALLCLVLYNIWKLFERLDIIQDIVTDYPAIEEEIKKYKAEGKRAEYDSKSGFIRIYDS